MSLSLSLSLSLAIHICVYIYVRIDIDTDIHLDMVTRRSILAPGLLGPAGFFMFWDIAKMLRRPVFFAFWAMK